MILSQLLTLLQTRPLLATELYNELCSLLRIEANSRTASPVPLSFLLELIICASVNLSVAPFESWDAVVECVFSDYERLTEASVERFTVCVPCTEDDFDQFCSEVALCGRHAVELLRICEVSSPSRTRVDSPEYSEAESDSSDSSVSGQEVVSTVKRNSSGSDNVLCKNEGGRSDDD